MSIYKLVQLSNEIEELLIESKGEITPEVEARLFPLEGEKRERVDRAVFFLKRIPSLVDFYKSEKKNLDTIIDSLELSVDTLKERFKAFLRDSGERSMEGNTYQVKISPRPNKVVIENEGIIPVKYCKEVIKLVPDRELIKLALERGEEVPGCRLEEVTALLTKVLRKELTNE